MKDLNFEDINSWGAKYKFKQPWEGGNTIKVRYYNENGKKIKKPLSGFLSRLFQHELDHLDGVLMVENSKIKSVYRISENKNVQKLYVDLVNKIMG